jgi:hypothetical protein
MAQASVASMLKALNDVNTADKSSKVYQQAARFLKASGVNIPTAPVVELQLSESEGENEEDEEDDGESLGEDDTEDENESADEEQEDADYEPEVEEKTSKKSKFKYLNYLHKLM